MSNQFRKGELEAAQQTIKFFETLLRASSDGIVITDATQNIVLVNEAFCAFFGRRWRDVNETNLFVWIEQLDDDGLRHWAEMERRVRLEGVCRDIELRLTTEAGMRYLSVSGSLLEPLADGETGVIISTWRDVTEYKQAEKALQVSEKKFRALYNYSPDMYVSVSPNDASILLCNETLLNKTGYSREEIIGFPIFKMYHEDCMNEVKKTFQQFVETGRIRDKELILKRKDGSKIDVNLNVDAIRDKAGKILYSISSCRDITERKWAEEALRKAHDKLEMRVEERTAELAKANEALRVEIAEHKRAKEAMWESEQRYELATDAGQVGVWDWNLETNEIYVDPLLKAILGYEDDEIRNHLDDWGKLIHPDDTERVMARTNTHLEGLTPHYEVTHRMVRKDGSACWFLARGTAIRDADGKPYRVVGTDTDITKRKQTEEALRESEKRYKQLVKSVTNYIYTVKVEIGRPISTTHGPGCVTVTGYTAKEYDTNPHLWHQMIYEEDRQTVIKQASSVLSEADVPPLVHRITHKNGSIRWVQNTPVRRYDEEGHLVAYDGLISDITERKQMEEKLKEAESRYRTIADFTYDWESWENPDVTLRYVSPACERITGYSVKQFIDKPSLSSAIIMPEDRDIWASHRHDVAEAPGLHEVQFRIRRQDGRTVWIEHACRPVMDEQGAFLGYRASNRDITERKRVEEALQARTRELALLNSAGRAFISSLELDQVLTTVLDQVRRIIEIVACSIWLVDPQSGDLVCREVSSPKDDIVRGWRLAPGQGLVGWVFQHGESLNIPDVRTNNRHFKGVDKQTDLQLRSILGVPLQTKKGVFGVLQLVDEAESRFSPDDTRLAESLATLAAIAIENARLYRQTQQDARIKTALLQEVNHRVKNNLMTISGLFLAEKRHAPAGEQAAVGAAMARLNQRLQGLAEVHSMLSRSEWSPISLPELFSQIIHLTLNSLLAEGQQVQVEVAQTSIEVSPRQAGNLALVINELATNTAKYVLPPDAKGTTARITVSLALEGNMIRIEYRDNGPGYPKEMLGLKHYDAVRSRSPGKAGLSVGLYLLQRIVTGTLGGRLSLANDNGAVTTIQFKTEEKSMT